MLSIATLVGLFASIFTALSQLPLIVKIFREKKAQGVSALMISVLLAGIAR